MTHHLTSGAVAALALVLFSACSSAKPEGTSNSSSNMGTGQPAGLAIGQKAPWPTSDWTVMKPEDMGMDSTVMEGSKTYAFADGQNTQAVVVVRGGAIVAEWYAPGKDQTSYAASWSMGKSFASALVGIMMDDGLIKKDIEAPISSLIPDWVGSPKGTIPLRSILQMESGLKWSEDYSPADVTSSDVIQIGITGDTFGYMLTKVGIKVAPDTNWYYSSGDSQLLSIAIQNGTGKSATDYARDKLFGPIGMNPVDWWVDGNAHTLTFCCLDTPTRQFAKFGLLYLRNGMWDGKQIVSPSWVKTSVTTIAANNPGYALQWWISEPNDQNPLPKDMFIAEGYDGQRIYVIPSLDLVVAKNTIYTKPVDANGNYVPAVAATGYLGQFAPSGFSKFGTLAAKLWEDAPFLAPIINSIQGSTKITAVATALGSPNDPAQCRQKAQSYGTYCEAMQGCVCDACASKFLDCDKNVGCSAIMKCGFENGCRGIACATPCNDVIQANGGVQSTGVTLALDLSNCAVSCPNACPDGG